MKKIIFILFCTLAYSLVHAQNKINSYEYWFDNDFLSKVTTNVTPVANYNLVSTIPTIGLPSGLHVFNVRFKDDSSKFSQVSSSFFLKQYQGGGPVQNNITNYEYWIDNDYASKTPVNITATQNFNLNGNIATSSTVPGLHVFNIRFRDSGGKWSQVLSQFFYKSIPTNSTQNDIVEYEFWYDNDYLSKINTSISPQQNFNLVSNLTTVSLPVGLHVMNIRFKDVTGKWSQVLSHFFNKTQSSLSTQKVLTTYQYWYDNDFASNVTQSFSPVSNYQMISSIPTGTLPTGLHTFNVRFKDTNNLWSQVLTNFIYKTDPIPSATNLIVAYRYWADNDINSATYVQLSTPVTNFNLNTTINMLNVPKGARIFNIQFKDTIQKWSVVQSDSFFRTPKPLASFNANTTTYCDSGTVSFANNSFDTDTYLWDFGDGFTSTDSTPVHTYTAPGSYTVSLLGTDTLMYLQDDTIQSAFITVNALPNVTATTTNDTLCIGQSTIFIASGNASNYSWSNGIINNQPYTPSNSMMVTLTGSNGICTNLDSVNIIVNPLPTVTVASVLPNDIVCNGTSVIASGGGASSYSWNGPQSISNLTPFIASQSGTYIVTGTDANLCTNTASFVMNVLALPSVTVASILPNDSICNGTSVTLNGGGAVVYNWNGPQVVNNGTPFNATLSGQYSVIGTDVNGCSNSATTSLTVHTLPVVSIGSVTPNDTVCSNTMVTFNGAGASNYSWNGPQNIVNATPFTAVNTGTYTVTGTDNNTCTNTATIFLKINTLPTVTVSLVNPNDTVCNGTILTIEATGATNYSWTGPQTITNNIPFISTTTGLYTVVGTDANLCTNSATKLITVNPLPNVSVASILPNDSVCNSTSVTMAGAGATSYSWNGPQAITNATPFNAINSGIYTLTGIDANGCSNSTSALLTVHDLPSVSIGTLQPNDTICDGTQVYIAATGFGAVSFNYSGPQSIINATPFTATTSGTYTITASSSFNCTNTMTQHIEVNPLPSVTVSTINPNDTVCDGTQLILAGSGASIYSWNGPQTISNNTAFTATSSGTYTVIGTDGNLCSNTSSISIIVNPIPVFSLGIDTSICQGTAITLNQPYPAATTLWSDNSIADTLNVNLAGTYSCDVILNGCNYTDTIQVGIDSLPIAYFGYVISNSEIDLSDSSKFGTSYKWYFGDGDSSTLANPTHIYLTNGNYTVTQIVNNECASDTFTSNVRIVTGITEQQINDVLIYPNPTSNQLYIDLKEQDRSHVSMYFIDLKGSLLMKENIIQAEKIIKLDVSSLNAGTYLLRIVAGNQTYVQRVTISK